MDSNSDKLTRNMTMNTNLTLLENGLLNGPKTQKMDLIANKMEKNEGAEIHAKYGKAAGLFKKLGGKTYDFVEVIFYLFLNVRLLH
ncbi:unnamed protein product [Meloidogyne enterolobii]|uniref:Uncharacterized protein n=1 Tax=Meloidogyne enterolobii TaxID=390850 RepID=A0ACB1AXZ3_MELEN